MMKKEIELNMLDDAEQLKTELDFLRERKAVQPTLTAEQKKRVLDISNVLGPTETELLTGVSDKNIFVGSSKWKA